MRDGASRAGHDARKQEAGAGSRRCALLPPSPSARGGDNRRMHGMVPLAIDLAAFAQASRSTVYRLNRNFPIRGRHPAVVGSPDLSSFSRPSSLRARGIPFRKSGIEGRGACAAPGRGGGPRLRGYIYSLGEYWLAHRGSAYMLPGGHIHICILYKNNVSTKLESVFLRTIITAAYSRAGYATRSSLSFLVPAGSLSNAAWDSCPVHGHRLSLSSGSALDLKMLEPRPSTRYLTAISRGHSRKTPAT